MTFSLIFFIIIHILVLVYLIETLRRTASRSREYPLEENPDTLPFGFLRLWHVVFLYVVAYLIWVVLSVWLYFVYIDPSFLSGSGTVKESDLILNL